ncbi:DUF397 domain-containing protein [Actinomadura rubrisoli]|uniref:DUF397 domain-containing protein n=1 Tax=Actinomadura rubrisoli TaxID=2530368 RepID=A0A4R5C372_9ACTN|nr:DUF397 domain-containing protein [Actinomadura rubrisoli]TDD93009.1 DUF397 domain-containing protein [Actinomadura rubrisoli]
MKRTDTSFAKWRKSSRSGGSSGQCVEVAEAAALVGIRDSKNSQAGHLAVDRAAFAVLVARVKSGDMDL